MKDHALFATVLLVILILLGTLFAALTLKTLIEVDHIGVATEQERTIVAQGTSSALAVPDMATVNVGVESSADTVEAAQTQNTTTMNGIISQIQEAGIPEADIQTTAYNIYEDEVYNPETGEFESRGWIVYQTIKVQIADTSLVSTVLDIAGRSGATDVFGPNYEVSDQDAQKEVARAEAIAEARRQAQMIASGLGAELGDVISYEEWTSGQSPFPSPERGIGLGGAEDAAIEPGTEELELNVSITYELVQ